jgi:rare lipoprotein A
MLLTSCSSTKEFSEDDSVAGTLIESGEASWYGPNFNGKLTANGETFDMYELTAAHRTLPFNSIVKVVNKANGKSVVVRINDRGPFAKNRIIDLSKKAAENIDMIATGYADVDLFLLSESKIPSNIERAHYTVQIGSFKNRNDAQKLTRMVSNTKIVKSIVNGGTYFRVYAGLFKNIDDAKIFKILLQNKGINGFVKQVEN